MNGWRAEEAYAGVFRGRCVAKVRAAQLGGHVRLRWMGWRWGFVWLVVA